SSIARLRAGFDGRVIDRDDPRYDQARAVFAGGIDRFPAVIVRPTNADEVARVVAVARDTGLELAVRSGGHSGAGHSVSEGGILLDLSQMRVIDIDVEGRTAWAETGSTAGEYTTAAAEYRLATGFGDSASVGIGGMTLGGGVGFLARKHGLTIDDLLAAEVVTADGQTRYVDASHESDLFWAIRGGGGNFGVATRFRYRLHPLESVVGGMLVLPATPEVIGAFIAEAEAAPDELTTIANVMPAPPMPFVPAEYHGQPVILGMMCFAGPADQAKRALAPFRALADPIADMVRPIRYPEMFPPDPEDYLPVSVARTSFVDSIDRAAAKLIVDRLAESSAAIAVTQLRVLGGALARVPDDATAYAHRGRRVLVNVAAIYEPGGDTSTHLAWVTDLTAALTGGDNSGYVNFIADEGPARVRAAYPGTPGIG
ncbi:MAG TPA: FAD-binding oxidoreductase, partial [Jiangellaceae bacterium]|nr:FAD-binding oxidoreductase [Jiangellaceae bacterium]